MSTMPFSVRYHLRGNRTDNPAHLRTMALQFADQMLQPPVYPPLGDNRIREDEDDCFIESLPCLERQPNFPSPRPERSFQLPGSRASNGILKVSQWLHLERPGGHRSNMPIDTVEWLNELNRGSEDDSETNLRVSQWVQGVEDARGDWLRTQKKSHRHGDKDDSDKDESAKVSNIRDSLQSCLQSMQPTLEVVRERHAALLETLNSHRVSMPQTQPMSGQTQWDFVWQDPGNMDNGEFDYLTPHGEYEWYNHGESY